MPQVVAHGRELSAARQRMRGVRVTHPMGTGAPQLLRSRRVLVLDEFRDLRKESLRDRPQPGRRDPRRAVLFEATHQRRRPLPPRRCRRQSALDQVAIEGGARQWRQGDLAGLAPLANEVQPMVTFGIHLDHAERGAHELAGAQARRVGEVDQEAQPLGGGRLPAIGPQTQTPKQIKPRTLRPTTAPNPQTNQTISSQFPIVLNQFLLIFALQLKSVHEFK